MRQPEKNSRPDSRGWCAIAESQRSANRRAPAVARKATASVNRPLNDGIMAGVSFMPGKRSRKKRDCSQAMPDRGRLKLGTKPDACCLITDASVAKRSVALERVFYFGKGGRFHGNAATTQ
jgi:hypothetical protein